MQLTNLWVPKTCATWPDALRRGRYPPDRIWAASPRTPPVTGQCSRPATLPSILGERFGSIRFLIRDRGSNFTAAFDAVFQAAGTRILRTAVQAPRHECDRPAPRRHPAP